MRIVAFNSSPRDGEASKTEMMLQSFLSGAREAGAATETHYLKKYHIKHCVGCFGCWLKQKGRCVLEDDMTEQLFGRFLEADLAVLATPLYHFTMNARMKAFIERTLPMLEPAFFDGRAITRPWRFQKVPRLVAISVGAFPEHHNFDVLSLNLRMIFGNLLVGEVYRHSSEFFAIPELASPVQEVLAAAAQAGREVVLEGKIQPTTQAAVIKDLAPREKLGRMANEHWRQQMAEHDHEPPQAEEDHTIDRFA